MKFVRNDVVYTVVKELSDKYETIDENGGMQFVPKALVRNEYNGTLGYFFTEESVKTYWEKKFNSLKAF